MGALPRPSRRVLVASVAAGVVLASSAGCGGGAGPGDPAESSAVDSAPAASAPADPGPIHVHGLGVNPGDGALFVATHAGLYRLAAAGGEAVRVAGSRHDLMGFAVARPDRFLGSGHPDPRDDLPHELGLIESRDAGTSWQAVSLAGEADFHVLRSHAEGLYAYDAVGGRLLVSPDGGGSWSERTVPEPLYDLAVEPGDGRHLLATGETGLHRSRDGGRTWRLELAVTGLLAWPAPDALYLVDPAGRVALSTDAAGSFEPVGELGGPPAAFAAESVRELYAAVREGPIVSSSDGGASWSVLWEPGAAG